MSSVNFVTLITCMDGRIQHPVSTLVSETYNCNYVDTITEPGPVKIISEQTNKALIDSIRNRLVISIEKHASKHIVVCAHEDCAGNPISDEAQITQLAQCRYIIQGWYPELSVACVWVNNKWQAEFLPLVQ